jgi:hypothetical protein
MSKTERYEPHRQLRERLSDSVEKFYSRSQNRMEIEQGMEEMHHTEMFGFEPTELDSMLSHLRNAEYTGE